MCNVINRKVAFTVLLSLTAGCGIKYATNRVLSNPDAIAKVGAVYDALTPRDTTERLVFIPGDTIMTEKTDTIYINGGLMSGKTDKTDTIRITTTKRIVSTDTIIKQLPPDNRKIARLSDSLALYKAKSNIYSGQVEIMYQQNKTAEKRLIWMAAVLLLAGVVIGVLARFKVKI